MRFQLLHNTFDVDDMTHVLQRDRTQWGLSPSHLEAKTRLKTATTAVAHGKQLDRLLCFCATEQLADNVELRRVTKDCGPR